MQKHELFVNQVEPSDINHFLQTNFLLSQTETVHFLKWFEIGHYKILKESVMACNFNDGISELGFVESVIYLNNTSFMIMRMLTVNYFDSRFHGYLVSYNLQSTLFCKQVHELKGHIPLNIRQVFYEEKECFFVAPRYVIF